MFLKRELKFYVTSDKDLINIVQTFIQSHIVINKQTKEIIEKEFPITTIKRTTIKLNENSSLDEIRKNIISQCLKKNIRFIE